MHVNIGLCSLVITGLNHVNRNSYQVEVHSIPDILKESNDSLRSMHILAETHDTPALNSTEFCSVVLGTEVSLEIFSVLTARSLPTTVRCIQYLCFRTSNPPHSKIFFWNAYLHLIGELYRTSTPSIMK